MKRGQILRLFLLEALVLALGGVASASSWDPWEWAGWRRKDLLGDVSGMTGALAMGSTMYGRFVPGTFAWLPW